MPVKTCTLTSLTLLAHMSVKKLRKHDRILLYSILMYYDRMELCSSFILIN